MNFTFPQNYYIWQLPTIGHDYPLPVHKYDNLETKGYPPPPPEPLGGVNGQIYLNFAITQLLFLTEVSHTGRGTIDMKHIKRGFNSKALV